MPRDKQIKSSMSSWSLFNYAEYYDERRLAALGTYKYNAVDKSLLSRYLLSYYWTWAATLFPIWMA